MFESAKSARRAITGGNDLYYFDKMQTSDQAQNMVGQLTQEAMSRMDTDIYTAGMIANFTCKTINDCLQGNKPFKSIYDNMQEEKASDAIKGLETATSQ